MGKLLDWIDDRSGLVSATRRALEHPVPPRTGWWYVFGSATLLAFVLQVVTGIALATAYAPSSGQAYDSLKFISEQALLGRFLRGMHYFGASAMVLLIGIHVSRTYLMAAYKFPRELNWLTGAVLLLLWEHARLAWRQGEIAAARESLERLLERSPGNGFLFENQSPANQSCGSKLTQPPSGSVNAAATTMARAKLFIRPAPSTLAVRCAQRDQHLDARAR